ncbi:helix-turn-helix domain-containing protein [Paenibacillus sp. FSL E2-0178]|uniref:helix-turn-helix domain-containing protein n=1 Tax=Paenibacillus sp. FSL E2-0178 TaxID=2921361 RepID=UPI003158C5DD
MHKPPTGSSLPYPHSFYVPVRIAALDKAASNREISSPPFSSLLIIVTGGSGTMEWDGALTRVSSGSTLCCDSSAHLTLQHSHNLQGVWIEYITLSGSSNPSSPLNNGAPLRSCAPRVCAMASRLLGSWSQPEEHQPFAVQQLFTELLTELYHSAAENTEPLLHWLDRVLQYIESHYNEDLTRGQAAELAGVTPEHFSRAFRKSTGQTFNEYVTLLRIRKAQKRILTGAPNLSTLALEVGYGEGTYLSRKFKQVVGLSPAAYHRKNKSVVSLNFNHTASLQALEVVPRLGVYSAWMERLQPVPSKHKLLNEGSSSTGLYERLSSARPDVIISYSLPDKNKQLMSLAPVIEIPFMQMDWREQFRLIAEVTGRRPQADAWLNVYDEQCNAANQQLDRRIGPRGTAVVWEIGRDAAYCFSSSYGHGSQILYNDLGFRPPSSLVSEGLLRQGYLEVAFSDVARYPADHIFITCSAGTAEMREPLRSFLHRAVQQNQASASGSRIYFLNQPAMFYGFDPLSSEAQLRVLLQALTS